MIKLTRFNHTEIVMNAELIEHIEATPDTVVSSVTGRKLLVLESVDEVIRRVVEYRRQVGPCIPRISVNAAAQEAEAEAAQKQQTGQKQEGH
jgi:flagellar protein FlbD